MIFLQNIVLESHNWLMKKFHDAKHHVNIALLWAYFTRFLHKRYKNAIIIVYNTPNNTFTYILSSESMFILLFCVDCQNCRAVMAVEKMGHQRQFIYLSNIPSWHTNLTLYSLLKCCQAILIFSFIQTLGW